MNRIKEINFGRASAWTVLFAIVLIGTTVITRKVLASWQFGGANTLTGLLAALAALVLAIIIESRFEQIRILNAFKNLGFIKGNRPQYYLVLIGVIPILLAYFYIIFFIKKSSALEVGAIFLLVKLTISQGLIEEAVFRGLIYRHLRVRNSYWKAATLSGILFALIHVANFSRGMSNEILLSVGISILFGFILTFPLAILFELGNGSILGGAILHLAIDSINCFKEIGEHGKPMNTYLFALIVLSVLIVGVGKKQIKVRAQNSTN